MSGPDLGLCQGAHRYCPTSSPATVQAGQRRMCEACAADRRAARNRRGRRARASRQVDAIEAVVARGRPPLRAGGGPAPAISIRLDGESGPALLRYCQEHADEGRPLPMAAAIRELATAWGEDERVRRAVAAWRARRVCR